MDTFIRIIAQREENKGVELTGDWRGKLEGRNKNAEMKRGDGGVENLRYWGTRQKVKKSDGSRRPDPSGWTNGAGAHRKTGRSATVHGARPGIDGQWFST